MVSMKCPKCGAPFEYEPGMQFKKCDYCGTMIYIDKSRVMFYYIIPFSLSSKKQAIEVFKRWAAGSTRAKGLENSEIKKIDKIYFPVYRFVRNVNNTEEEVIKPAKTTLLPGLTTLKLPPGNMRILDSSFKQGDARVLQPDVSMDTYLPALEGEAKEQEIVYFPLYEIRYIFNGKEHSVIIDGSSGEVFTSYYPPRVATPYMVIGASTFILSAIGAAGGTMISSILWVMVGVGFLVGAVGGFIIAKKY